MLSEGIGGRKIGFYSGFCFLLLFLVSTLFAAHNKRAFISPDQAIIMTGAAPIKSSPDAGSKDVFVLHAGTKVGVKSSLGDWREITLSDGNRGWVEASAIELID